MKNNKAKMTRRRRWLSVLLAFAVLAVSCLAVPAETYAASGEVNRRIAAVRKDFPTKSKFTPMIYIIREFLYDGMLTVDNKGFGGCDGLVNYVTIKTFHTPFYYGSPDFTQVGKKVKASNKKQLKKLFKKAKKGDVIYLSDKGGREFHVAIFLKKSKKGVKVYEGNAGGSRHQVFYNRLWSWKRLKKDHKGKEYVSIYRANNYAQVNAGQAAVNYGAGSTFTANGITYQVVTPGLRAGVVKVVSGGDRAGSIPAAIGLNFDHTERLSARWAQTYAANGGGRTSAGYFDDEYGYGGESDIEYANEVVQDEISRARVVEYSSNVGGYYDEQYFTVAR